MTELNPSRLGTKSHWDHVYAEELKNFDEIGDEGEIWFGEASVEKMAKHVPPANTLKILEVGCGNATLLLALAEEGYAPTTLTGIDYSSDSIRLSESVAKSRGFENLTFETLDFLEASPTNTPGTGWDLLLDKGTYDAIALGAKDGTGKSPASRYPERVKTLLKPGGFFLITSCNFTEDELRAAFATPDNSLRYHSSINHPTFSFGGNTGSTVSSVAFELV
ncbi:S-adenosyl-L-methionine-dependent methyltransferase [Flagelloscypha sp. PMI_526]|nr:S-adenosyl-L-methionine-dependent methyltransferase [Flagelloscypha sp. PMI_526]